MAAIGLFTNGRVQMTLTNKKASQTIVKNQEKLLQVSTFRSLLEFNLQ